MTKTMVFDDIRRFWVSEDKEKFKAQIIVVLNQGIDKHEILKFLQDNKPDNRCIDEDFEQWAYMLVVTEGASDCPPG